MAKDPSYSSTPERSVEEDQGYLVPNWDQRGIMDEGYAIQQNFDDASKYVDNDLQSFLQGTSRFSMSSIAPGGTYEFGSGTLSAPGIRWAADTDSGFYLPAVGDMAAVIGGVEITSWTASGFTIDALTPTHVLYAGAGGLVSGDAGLTWDATADTLSLSSVLSGSSNWKPIKLTTTDPDAKSFYISIADGGNFIPAGTRKDIVMDIGYNMGVSGPIDTGDVSWGLQFETYADQGGTGLIPDVEFWLAYAESGGFSARPIGCTVARSSHRVELTFPTTSFYSDASEVVLFTTPTVTITQDATTSGSVRGFQFIAGAHTGSTASTERVTSFFDLSANVTWDAGNITIQRGMLLQAPTYTISGGASAITDAATFAISGAPIAGSSTTLTRTQALWVQSGMSRLDGIVRIGSSSSVYTDVSTDTNGYMVFDSTGGRFGFEKSAPEVLMHLGTGGTTQGYIRIESAGAASRTANLYAPSGGGLQVDTTGNGFPIRFDGSLVYVSSVLGVKNSAPAVAVHVGTGGSLQGYIRLESAGAASRTGNIYSPSGGGIQMDTSGNGFPILLNGSAVQLRPGTTTVVDVNTTSFVVNDAGGDIDSRFEGDNKTSNLLLDASDDEVAIDGRFSLIDSTPAQITADQNDYVGAEGTATSRSTVWRISSDAARNITGIGNPLQGRVLTLINVGAQNIVIQNQNALSTAANRVITGTGADVTLAADDTMDLWYDSTTARWRAL